ncbi:hypothetical protein G7Z17_g1075 [Cylindrodendrum hubeiense]|uniref:Uncharacterized protein n=1 Tax=Cylindrodendrum hubeiense TaxID=595255 RepID=A0A9P5LLT2_9HYPO|nr:hypothetical protein G7Z17_g1075 [Cylindrodendrum hubeiense]
MRVSLFALPALATLAYAGPCRPSSSETADVTSTSSESIFSTSTSETASLSTEIETTTTATVGESTTSLEPDITTTSAEAETTTTSTVEESTTSIEPITTTTALESTTTSAVEESTTSLEPVITTTSTALESTTTSATPEPTTTVLGFCIKAISTDKINSGYHVAGGTTQSNQVLQSPSNTVYNLYNLDVVTGAVTLNNTDPGKQLYIPTPFTGQNIRVVRFTTAPVTNGAVLCSIPSGDYASGSTLKCTATGTDTSGTSIYNQFTASSSSSSAPWSLMREGYSSASYYSYDMGMFFGSDCKSQESPAK